MADYKRAWTKSLYLNTRLEPAAARSKIFDFAEAQVKKTAPNVPHPLSCINAIRAGVEFNGEHGLETEQKEFGKVAVSNTSKALIHFFFASKGTGKVRKFEFCVYNFLQVPGLDANIQPRKIKKLAVLGAGTMGSGIVAASYVKFFAHNPC